MNPIQMAFAAQQARLVAAVARVRGDHFTAAVAEADALAIDMARGVVSKEGRGIIRAVQTQQPVWN